MKKNYIFTALLLVTATQASMAAITSSSGTLTINGEITQPTCVAEISSTTGTATGTNNSLTLTLPTVPATNFTGANTTTGATPFVITLTQSGTGNTSAGQPCTVIKDTDGTDLTPNLWFNNTDANINTATGNLKNIANVIDDVNIQLLNDAGTAIDLTADQLTQVSSQYNVNDGTLDYTAQYISTEAKVTAQTVQTVIGFNVVYK